MAVSCDHTDVMDLEFRYRDFNFIHGIGHGTRDVESPVVMSRRGTPANRPLQHLEAGHLGASKPQHVIMNDIYVHFRTYISFIISGYSYYVHMLVTRLKSDMCLVFLLHN